MLEIFLYFQLQEHNTTEHNPTVNLHWLLQSLKNNITYELGQRASGCCIFVYFLHFWLNEETLISYILVFYRELKWFCSETTGSCNCKSGWFWRKNFLFTGSWLVTETVLGWCCKKVIKLLNVISFKTVLRHYMSLLSCWLEKEMILCKPLLDLSVCAKNGLLGVIFFWCFLC